MQPTLSLWAAVRARSVKLRGFRFAALPLSGKIVRFRLPVVKNIFSLDGIITVCSHEGKGRWLIYNDLNHLISIFTKNGWHRVGSGAKTGGTERVNDPFIVLSDETTSQLYTQLAHPSSPQI